MAHTTPRVRDGAVAAQDQPALPIAVGSPAWFTWLESIAAFVFEDPHATYTARKERYQRGGAYWRAYRKQAGVLQRVYIGTSRDLSLARLQAVAQTIARRGDPDRRLAPPVSALRHAHLLLPDSATPAPAVLAAKITVPALPQLLERAALHARLDEVRQYPVMLVSAAAGYGKTALLSAWCRAAGDWQMPTAWVALDADDDAPAHFWRLVMCALDRLYSGFADVRFFEQILDRDATPVDDLSAALAVMPHPLRLVLDNYQVIGDPSIHRALGRLLEYLPPQVHVVVATRIDPPWPLARWRAEGRLLELRTADLRLNAGEVAAVLRSQGAAAPAQHEIDALVARIDGWIAGACLLARTLPGQSTAAAPAAVAERCPAPVAAYFASEVWPRYAPALQRFMLDTAILDQLSAPVCAAVCGREDSPALLETLWRTNAFLEPVAEHGGAYSYHPLFREFLRQQVHAAPAAHTALHRRAAVWYAAHDRPDTAITHALAGADTAGAARLLTEHAERLLVEGKVPALQEWIAALPPDEVAANARLALLAIRTHMFSGQFDRISAQVRAATAHHPRAATTATVPGGRRKSRTRLPRRTRGDVLVLHALHALIGGDRPASAALLAQASRLVEPGDLVPGSVLGALRAMTAWMRGDLAAVDQVLQTTHATHVAHQITDLARLALSHQAHLDVLAGRLQAASIRYRRVLCSVDQLHTQPPAAAGMAAMGLSRVLYERNELPGALAYARQAAGIWQRRDNQGLVVQATAQQARIEHARGNAEQACELLAQAERLVWQQHMEPPVLVVLATVQAELLLAQRDTAGAVAWLEQYRPAASDYVVSAGDAAQLTWSKALLVAGQLDAAMARITQLREQAELTGRRGQLVACLALEALVWEAQGRRSEALERLERAIAAAVSEGYRRSIMDAGPGMPALLGQLLRQTSHAAYVRALIGAVSSRGQSAPRRPAAQFLSKREGQVLRLVAEGASNQEIATRLVITVSTVKKHLRHCFYKLNVRSRTQAVAAARTLAGAAAD